MSIPCRTAGLGLLLLLSCSFRVLCALGSVDMAASGKSGCLGGFNGGLGGTAAAGPSVGRGGGSGARWSLTSPRDSGN